MRSILLVLVCVALVGCASTDRVTSRASKFNPPLVPGSRPLLGGPIYLQLPAVPAGCIVRVYHIRRYEFRGAPFTQTDWCAFLRAQGMIFPRGGFATYFPATATLIVANTPEQLALLDLI